METIYSEGIFKITKEDVKVLEDLWDFENKNMVPGFLYKLYVNDVFERKIPVNASWPDPDTYARITLIHDYNKMRNRTYSVSKEDYELLQELKKKHHEFFKVAITEAENKS